MNDFIVVTIGGTLLPFEKDIGGREKTLSNFVELGFHLILK